MVFRVMGIIRTDPEPKWIPDRIRNIQNFHNMISIPNMYSKYIEHLK